MPETKKSISFIGAGNVATHLARAFNSAGYSIGRIYSKTHVSALALAEKVGARACTSLAEVLQNTQLVIVTIPEDAFSLLMDFVVPANIVIVHTCGSLEMNVFNGKASHYGVLYPIQTFSQKVVVELQNVPFCIEASDKETLEVIRLLASSVSKNVIEIDSDRRRVLHLAAVFANNFPNAMYALADDILKTADLPFRLLHPLIMETARKATIDQPWNVQTGPARRNGNETIKIHEAMLEDKGSYKEIYSLLSKIIQSHYLE